MADTKLSALAAVVGSLADLYYLVSGGVSKQIAAKNMLGLLPITPGGRLTLTSGTPVTTGDVAGATTLYWTPFLHGGIQLWDGTQWVALSSGEVSLALSTMTSDKPYDVFGFLSSGALALEKLAWTNGTTRATAVSFQDGRLCKTGDKTRLLLGSFYTTSTTETEDSAAKRYLSNLYNPVARAMQAALETTNSWTYSTATFRQANANDANALNWMSTYPLHAVRAVAMALASLGASSSDACVGIGLDSTSTNSALIFGGSVSSAMAVQLRAEYLATVAVGKHYLAWLERGNGSGTLTWYGDNNDPTNIQSGIVGEVYN